MRGGEEAGAAGGAVGPADMRRAAPELVHRPSPLARPEASRLRLHATPRQVRRPKPSSVIVAILDVAVKVPPEHAHAVHA